VTTPLTLSAVQYQALDGGIAANLAEHIRLIEDADSHGSRLVIFPELSLTGHEPQRLADPEQWLTPADSRLDGIHEICRRTGVTAVVGAPYREPGGTPRLASLAVHPSGTVDCSFEVWLHGAEAEWFTPGERAAVLVIDGWRVALAACFDAAHPAHAGAAAAEGADVYAFSALYTAAEERRLDLHLGAWAMDHRMYSVLANLGGSTSAGKSGFWGPDGVVLRKAAGTGTEVLTATLMHPAARI
jgi:predicted amidohydrolase